MNFLKNLLARPKNTAMNVLEIIFAEFEEDFFRKSQENFNKVESKLSLRTQAVLITYNLIFTSNDTYVQNH